MMRRGLVAIWFTTRTIEMEVNNNNGRPISHAEDAFANICCLRGLVQ